MQDLSRGAALAPPIPVLSAQDSVRMSSIFDRLAIGVLAALGVVALLTFRDYGLSWDDYAHSEYGDLLLQFYASGLRDQRALSWVNLYYYGGGFDLLAAVAAKFLPLTLFETRRLVGAAVGISGCSSLGGSVAASAGRPAGLIALVAARGLSALLRPHVHQSQGRPVRRGHGHSSVRPGAVLRRISARVDSQPPRSPALVSVLSFGSRIMGAFGALDTLGGARLDLCRSKAVRWAFVKPAPDSDISCLALVPAMVLAYL